jgi:hypothetical protein
MFGRKMSEGGEGGGDDGAEFDFWFSFVGHDFPLTSLAICLFFRSSFIFLTSRWRNKVYRLYWIYQERPKHPRHVWG